MPKPQTSQEDDSNVLDVTLLAQLNKLSELRKNGKLSEDEFIFERKKILSSCFDAYYHHIQPNQVVFDTNRDGTYGDTVRTIANVDAFSPGFCGGAAMIADDGLSLSMA